MLSRASSEAFSEVSSASVADIRCGAHVSRRGLLLSFDHSRPVHQFPRHVLIECFPYQEDVPLILCEEELHVIV